MKLLLLADPNSVHTIKWACSLVMHDIEIKILGLGALNVDSYNAIDNISIETMGLGITRNEGAFKKISYLKALPAVKKTIRSFKPDILHAHFASSYGILGALSGFTPFILSVWGSDVFSFPNKSAIHKSILKFNLKKADKVLSTSKVMAIETNKYTDKEIEVTPFGIDLDQFRKKEVDRLFSKDDIIIGTVKTLSERYGIDYLIRAFKIVKDRNPALRLKLLLVGGGNLEQELKELSHELNIQDDTIFTGSVTYSDIAHYHNQLDISVFLSNSESFGVAVIEASACEKPVVVSNVGGLPEVVEDKVSGLIVSPQDPEAAAEAIETLVKNEEMRLKIGQAGRLRVEKNFNWKDNVQQMVKIYMNVKGDK